MKIDAARSQKRNVSKTSYISQMKNISNTQQRELWILYNLSFWTISTSLIRLKIHKKSISIVFLSSFQIASLCLSTVQNTLVELSLLNVSVVEGAAACWAQLACAETLRACERLAASNNAMEMCTATQAPLLHNAKDKVDLGDSFNNSRIP